MRYATTSTFWLLGHQAFLRVPYDCTKVDVSDKLLSWRIVVLHNTPGLDNRSLSLIGYTYEELILGDQGSLAWKFELLLE
jgi:hypothetical protein